MAKRGKYETAIRELQSVVYEFTHIIHERLLEDGDKKEYDIIRKERADIRAAIKILRQAQKGAK